MTCKYDTVSSNGTPLTVVTFSYPPANSTITHRYVINNQNLTFLTIYKYIHTPHSHRLLAFDYAYINSIFTVLNITDNKHILLVF